MCHRHRLLHCHQRASERGVHIAHHEYTTRLVLVKHGLKAAHHFSGLHGMRARADFEVDIGPRQAQVIKELLAHALVVVLAGVQQQRRQRRLVRCQSAQDRGHLHEIGPRAHDAHHRPWQ